MRTTTAPEVVYTLHYNKITWTYAKQDDSGKKSKPEPTTFTKEWSGSPQFAIKEQGSKIGGNVSAGWDLEKNSKK